MIQAKGGWHWLMADPDMLDLLPLLWLVSSQLHARNTPQLSWAFCFLPNCPFQCHFSSNFHSRGVFLSLLLCSISTVLTSPLCSPFNLSESKLMHHLRLVSVILITQTARWIQRNRGMCTLQKRKLLQNFAKDKGFQLWATLSFEIHWSRECKSEGLFFSWPFAA